MGGRIHNCRKQQDSGRSMGFIEIEAFISIFVPKVKPSGKPSWNDKGIFPIQKSLQEAIYTKTILHRQWMAAKTRGDADAIRLSHANARNKLTTMMCKAKRKHEKEIALKSQSNPEAFWSHIYRKLKTKTGIAPLLENNKDKTSTKFNDLEKANIPQKQYFQVFLHMTRRARYYC